MKTRLADTSPKDIMDDLADIEVADLLVKAHQEDIDQLIQQVKRLAEDLGCLDCIGLYVLHKHHDEQPGKVLVRSYDETSMRVSLKDHSDDLTPASWMLVVDEEGDGVLLPTEWASDAGAREQLDRLLDTDFFDRFGELVNGRGMHDIIGLTLNWANELVIDEGQILVEQTDVSEGEAFIANVVRPEQKDTYNEDDLTPTNWFFASGRACSCRRVPAECVEWRTFCIRWSPGHSRVTRCVRKRLRHRRVCIG